MNQKSFLDFIQSRRTCYQFLSKKEFPISSEFVEHCLQAAIYAPNHKLTQPWLFWVAGESFQQKLANIYADNRALKNASVESDNKESIYLSLYQKAFDKFNEIPQVILVGQRLSNDPVVCKEDYAACACAIQNFQLMAWSLNIGVQWSTGPIISDQRTYDLLDINREQVEIIGALYLGVVDNDCKPNNTPKRKPINEVTVHLD